MRFGICYNLDYHADVHKSPGNYYADILDQCVLLEELGYDSAWFSEHHTGRYSFGNPALMIAMASQRTKRLRLGSGVSLLPLHHPIPLCEEYGMLDHLSGGRLEYGVGRGNLWHEYPWMNVPLEDSSKRYREALDFIIQAWTSDGRMSFNGEFFKAENYTPFPGVVQKPTPPIYVSTVSPETFPYAGAKNLNIGLVLFAPGNEAIPANVAAYKQALRAGGFDPAKREVMGITQMYCGEDERGAVDDGVKYAENYHRFFVDLVVAVRGAGDPFAEIMSKVNVRAQNENNQTLLGSPKALIEKITRMRDEWHVDYLQLEVAQGGLPPDKVRQVLRLFAEKVMPHFK